MVMLHKLVFALAVFSAASFDLVSQTFNGSMSFNVTMPGLPSVPAPSLATVFLGLDMEKVSFRMDTHIVITMSKFNITTDRKTSEIFDAATKRVTKFAASTTTGPAPATTSQCSFVEVPQLPAPADVRKCVTDMLAPVKPVDVQSSGRQMFEFNLSLATIEDINFTLDARVYADKSCIVKEMLLGQSSNGITTHADVVAMDSKKGAPDSSVFLIPPEWGACQKADTPSMQVPSSSQLHEVFQCLGMGPNQAAPIFV